VLFDIKNAFLQMSTRTGVSESQPFSGNQTQVSPKDISVKHSRHMLNIAHGSEGEPLEPRVRTHREPYKFSRQMSSDQNPDRVRKARREIKKLNGYLNPKILKNKNEALTAEKKTRAAQNSIGNFNQTCDFSRIGVGKHATGQKRKLNSLLAASRIGIFDSDFKNLDYQTSPNDSGLIHSHIGIPGRSTSKDIPEELSQKDALSPNIGNIFFSKS
jgi:hypothetical protein